ncbi:hypothetical protein HC251_13115 [Iamia sp. SCSIO 61187]|uniref:transposase n=1 Tax=Iamia sp. SCSIO 61187 TaxID=2722752 RepID=UPI001C6376A4|nr:transposase [Iamia sp. SCSIO 61187]QYG93268.1 hypothetical protein HC251_13115 [Iamia sp. SCSIO 61187]
MNRGVDHQPVFLADEDRLEFGRQLARAHDELGVSTLAYCLMGNHFHLLVRAPGETLSTAMQHVISVYTRHTNDRVGRDGPLFRGRFHSIPVETDAYLLQATRYIHRNPLPLRGVDSPAEYRWSSYRTYLGLRPAPAFLDIAPVTALLGGPDAVAAFTEGEVAPTGRCASVRIEDLRQLIDCAIAVDDLTHREDEGTRRWLARTVLLLLGDRSSDPILREIVASELGHPSPEAARSALRRARQRQVAEPMVGRVLAWVEAELARSVWV